LALTKLTIGLFAGRRANYGGLLHVPATLATTSSHSPKLKPLLHPVARPGWQLILVYSTPRLTDPAESTAAPERRPRGTNNGPAGADVAIARQARRAAGGNDRLFRP